jgi:hypothetical protein
MKAMFNQRSCPDFANSIYNTWIIENKVRFHRPPFSSVDRVEATVKRSFGSLGSRRAMN